MIDKHHLARWIRTSLPIRWALSIAMRLFAPRNHIGAVGVIFNNTGQVLLVEHVFRLDSAWGLPGGWVERGENPINTVQRELKEELHLTVKVKKLLNCEPQGSKKLGTTPKSLGLAYYCRLAEDTIDFAHHINQADKAYEILSIAWVDPDNLAYEIEPLHRHAILLGKQEFERETLS